MTFGKKQAPPIAPAIPHKLAPGLLDRLEAQRQSREDEFAKLNQELIELDAQIAGLKRAKAMYPQIEGLIESLRWK